MAYSQYEIGERMRRLRKEYGYTLEQVAEACGVQQYQTVSKWESGNTVPAMKQLLNLCNLYCCDIGYLLGEYDCKTRHATDIQASTGLSEKSIQELKTRAVLYPETTKALNAIIEFNRGDIIDLVSSFLLFDFADDVDTGTGIIKGQALENMYLMEICAELKAMKQRNGGK